MNPNRKPYTFDTPATYRIRLEGSVDKQWSGYLGGMTVSVARRSGQPPVTTLTGELIDQAALLGILNAVYDRGFALLTVERLHAPASAAEPQHPVAATDQAG
jgi:hypothetical protein